MKKKAREVFDKKMARILVLVFFDIIAIALASLFALWIRFDFGVIPAKYLHTVTQYLPIDTLIIIAVFAITGLYTSVWRYASIPELISVICFRRKKCFRCAWRSCTIFTFIIS